MGAMGVENERADAGRDAAEPTASRDQILKRERGQGKNMFPNRLTTSRIGDLTRLVSNLLHVMAMHTDSSHSSHKGRMRVAENGC